MPIRTEILASFYQDSMVLMRVASQVRSRTGVHDVAAFMGTPANHALLEQVGMATAETRKARPTDLILAVNAQSEAEADAALVMARELLMARRQAAEKTVEIKPRTLDSAMKCLPNANLVLISVPGAFAKFEAMRALRRGLHVFLFSNNVPLEDEIELKQEALRRQLLCMGPDCGTAYLNGVGLGFANIVPRGRIGIVAAAGTGLQAVTSHLVTLGEGISHGIGVGGRDLSAEVKGAMTFFVLEALASDAATEAIVLVAKTPHPAVMPRLEATLEKIKKPTIAFCLGLSKSTHGRVFWVKTLEEAAEATAAILRKQEWAPRNFTDPEAVRIRLNHIRNQCTLEGSGILGLYTGGTLAHEAHLVLEPLLGPIGFNDSNLSGETLHRIIDLGDDAYTIGRPHPMIDPERRSEFIENAGTSGKVGILLFDVVLGKGSHPDPARPLASALKKARSRAEAKGRHIAALASVIGTPGDAQNLARQVEQLEEVGVEVFPSNAQAARFAALLVKPELSALLLENSP